MSDTSHSPTVIVLALFAAFAAFSVAFWACFRFRGAEEEEAENEPAWVEVG